MTATDEGLRAQQTNAEQSCPAWCATDHSATGPAWRVHAAAPRTLELTQARPTDRLVVELAAEGVAISDALIYVWRESTNSGFCLTMTEARRLAAELLAITDEANRASN
jgi:hypothetical protein